MNILFILDDPPYGTERCYNALRLARAILETEPRPEVSVFLMADSVGCAKAGQTTPNGAANLGRMIKGVAIHARVLLCGTCMDARGIGDGDLVEGAVRGTMAELARLTLEADKVLTL